MRMISLLICFMLALAASAFAKPQPGPNLKAILSQTPAETLSAYGLFADAGARLPAAGVEPYTLATPLFSDYALKRRYLYLPPGAKARYSATETFEFPVGAVLIKTFAYPADMRAPQDNIRFLETRLLIKKSTGWAALEYVWHAAQTEARLAQAGADIPVKWTHTDGSEKALTWSAPNRNQCKGCHAMAGAITPIGPKARNLTHAPAGNESPLARFVRLGLIADAPNPEDWPKAVAYDDPAASIESRARAYLDVNCAHCHNPLGPANNAGLELSSLTTDPLKLGIGKRPVAAGRGGGDRLIAIAPGHPDASILAYRLESTEPGEMMPELGRQLVHAEGAALIRQWIAEMR
jgi:uncharacterized repeat protein (TIGR03806 family)